MLNNMRVDNRETYLSSSSFLKSFLAAPVVMLRFSRSSTVNIHIYKGIGGNGFKNELVPWSIVFDYGNESYTGLCSREIQFNHIHM